jgi:hypothetical protein
MKLAEPWLGMAGCSKFESVGAREHACAARHGADNGGGEGPPGPIIAPSRKRSPHPRVSG